MPPAKVLKKESLPFSRMRAVKSPSMAFATTVLTSFSVAPLRFASLLGVLLASAAFLFGLSILWEVFTTGKQVPGYPSLVIGLMTIGGVQLIMIGIVGEYIGKILSELKARPIYFVAEHNQKNAEVDRDASASERTATPVNIGDLASVRSAKRRSATRFRMYFILRSCAMVTEKNGRIRTNRD